MKYLQTKSDKLTLFGLVLILFLPVIPLLYRLVYSNNFFFFTFGDSRDQGYYVSRANAIFIGKSPAFLSGNSRSPDLRQGEISNYLNFFPGHLVGINGRWFPTVYFLTILVLVLLLAFSIYRFVSLFTVDARIKLFLIATFLFVPALVDGRHINIQNENLLYRWPAPLFHYFLVFLCLISILEKTRRPWVEVIIFWYSVFFYFYTWQIIGALIIVGWAYDFLVGKDTKLKDIGLRTLSLFPPLLFYIYGLLDSRNKLTPIEYIHFELANKLEHSHRFTLTISICILGILAILAHRFKLQNRIQKLGILLLFASIIVMNQNIVTGFILQPGHFHWYFEYPFSFFYFALVAHGIATKFVPKARAISMLVGSTSILVILMLQVNSFLFSVELINSRQSMQSTNLAKTEDLNGKFLTFDTNIGNYLVTSSGLDTYFDRDYGAMYPPSINKSVDFTIANLKWGRGDTDKSNVNFTKVMDCISRGNPICGNIELISLAFDNLYGIGNGEIRFKTFISNRISLQSQDDLAKFMRRNSIDYFFSRRELINAIDSGLKLFGTSQAEFSPFYIYVAK